MVNTLATKDNHLLGEQSGFPSFVSDPSIVAPISLTHQQVLVKPSHWSGTNEPSMLQSTVYLSGIGPSSN